MQIGNAKIDLTPFDSGFLGAGGYMTVPPRLNPDYSAAQALYGQTIWTIYEYDCRGPSEKKRKIDGSGRLILDPILVFYGKGSIDQKPSKKSIIDTYKAVAKAVGVSSPQDLDSAFGKVLGFDRIPVPWADIQKNHTPQELYEVSVNANMAAYKISVQGATLPGDAYLLIPMAVSFISSTQGFCLKSGRFEYYLGNIGYYNSVMVRLSGKGGKDLQREEAKRRVQIIEKLMKEVREDGLMDAEKKEGALKGFHREIDELINY